MATSNRRPASVTGACWTLFSKIGTTVAENSVMGSLAAVRGGASATKSVFSAASRLSRKFRGLLRSREPVDVKLYIETHKTPPNVLVRVPAPPRPQSGPPVKAQVLDQLGEALSAASEADDADNLTILNLDGYFDLIEEEK